MDEFTGSRGNPVFETAKASKPKWRTPGLSEDAIASATWAAISAGIDAYEASNPVNYGS